MCQVLSPFSLQHVKNDGQGSDGEDQPSGALFRGLLDGGEERLVVGSQISRKEKQTLTTRRLNRLSKESLCWTLNSGFPKSEMETRIWVQVVSVEGDSKKYGEKARQGRREESQ